MDDTNSDITADTPEKKQPKKIIVSEHIADEEVTVEENDEQEVEGASEESEAPVGDVAEEEIVDAEQDDASETEEAPLAITEEDGVEETEWLDDTEDGADDAAMEAIASEDTQEPVEEESSAELDPEKTIGELAEEAPAGSDVFEPDPEIDAAVDEIVRAEGDDSLQKADEELAKQAAPQKRSFFGKIAGFFKAWWRHKLARYATLAGLFIGLTAVVLVPITRYGLLNLAGVRVEGSLSVIDAQTRLPLKNIAVAMQGKTEQTDEEGRVRFSDLKLGRTELVISKIGYATNEQTVVLGWGSNPMGQKEIVATGEQFTFMLRDWLNDAPIIVAQAESGESSAKADSEGKIILTVGEEAIAGAQVTIKAEGYREETLALQDVLGKETSLSLVPSRRHVFVSNRDGKFDLYAIDVDGKNEQLLLAATEKERDVPVLAPHPSRDLLGLISSRSGEQNRDGYVVDELFLVDGRSGELERIARSEQIAIVGWHEDTIVFWQVVEGTSRANPERTKLVSYNERTGERKELAGSNYFNDVRMVNGVVYYAVSSYAVPQSQAKLYAINADGTNRVKIVDELVYSIFRTGYTTLQFAADNQKWYQRVGDGPVTEVATPAQPLNRKFVDSPDKKRSVWVEIRDGRGVLLVTDLASPDSEERVITLAGLDSVQYWLNNHTLVFRVIKSGETADYVLSLDNPTEQKIVDVTASNRLYY